jgi:uncharacterized coiled-coil protein SlyX
MTLDDRMRELELRRAEMDGLLERSQQAAKQASVQILKLDAQLALLKELMQDGDVPRG